MQLKFVEMPTKKIDVPKFEFIDHKFLRVVRYSTVPPHAVWAWVGDGELNRPMGQGWRVLLDDNSNK